MHSEYSYRNWSCATDSIIFPASETSMDFLIHFYEKVQSKVWSSSPICYMKSSHVGNLSLTINRSFNNAKVQCRIYFKGVIMHYSDNRTISVDCKQYKIFVISNTILYNEVSSVNE